ncbi:ParB/RepB/Spo0J family partition protein [Aliiroseovarius crassostreae]|uniref:ParB/RepB/Spo0J family partition protein n=1 Tax=Aliiroseovarius crassostreae TaxID=154981 RepID=UPI00220CEA04|nr:ParB/RepB/Spo0J family partition protein [Aliiroseovarius crassostreae]UWP90786.1 ParB/RepB/Spo0J family partition protein [Aliiroseovarius crassostreae]UWQ03449.1 ParB/RepB/Spo0J family partition protein [Aliiroseovarius crassostreae]
MAKRRKLQAPSAADLDRLEQEFRRETPMKGAMAPIAQVAADAAGQSPVLDTASREKIAKDAADADELRVARGRGLVMVEVDLSEIDLEDMIRDRVNIDPVELEELKTSISANGLRLPVELYELNDASNPHRFGVVSGFRRVLAIKDLLAETGRDQFKTVKALIKPIETVPDAFVAMVEENEVRSQLSHFERGRIAVISTQKGAFETVEGAVSALFASASKAKRSKVRSFAHVFEEMGDLMLFASELTEKQGLRLAGALRMGHVQALRECLAHGEVHSAEEEWSALLPVIEAAEEGPKDSTRGGRPKSSRKATSAKDRFKALRRGEPVVIKSGKDASGFFLRLEGAGVDEAIVEALTAELTALLSD